MKKFFVLFVIAVAAFLVSCAGERQGMVCEELEYRLNTQTYTPDQRAFMEDELQSCRAEEAQKKNESAATRKSIYERYAANDSTAKTADEPRDVSVSEALKDSSGVETESIYDRYSNKNSEASADTSANEVSNFQ